MGVAHDVDWTRAKALTVRQPWASLIARGVKRVENRVWRLAWAGPVLIHAGGKVPMPSMPGRQWLGQAAEALGVPPEVGAGRRLPWSAAFDGLPYSAIVAGVERVSCYSLAELQTERVDVWNDQARWVGGPWCWVLEGVVAIEPVACRGGLKLWRPGPAVMAEVVSRLVSASGGSPALRAAG